MDQYIKNLLSSNNKAVERAIIVLFNRQTQDEQENKKTIHHNGRGFNAIDARRGTYIAKYLMSGNSLSGKWIEEARKISLKYVSQLVEEANLKKKISEKREQDYISLEREAIKFENGG